MNAEIINALRLGLGFIVIFGLAELLFHCLGLKAEITRKFSHISAGLMSLSFPLFFNSHWTVLLLCLPFALILWLSLHYGLLPSINAVDRLTHGSLLFPLVVYLCFYVASQLGSLIFFYLPILILAISDPLAALAGKAVPLGPYLLFGQIKTLLGSAAFFCSALLGSGIALWYTHSFSYSQIIPACLLIASATTLAEAATHKGYDNLMIPAAAIAALYLAQQIP